MAFALSTIKEIVELRTVDTNRAVQSAIDDLEVRIREKGAVDRYTLLPMVKGNEAYLTQLFLNLIGNALKFTERPPVVNISAARSGETVFIPASSKYSKCAIEDATLRYIVGEGAKG